jgi:hypothetical protein
VTVYDSSAFEPSREEQDAGLRQLREAIEACAQGAALFGLPETREALRSALTRLSIELRAQVEGRSSAGNAVSYAQAGRRATIRGDGWVGAPLAVPRHRGPDRGSRRAQ